MNKDSLKILIWCMMEAVLSIVCGTTIFAKMADSFGILEMAKSGITTYRNILFMSCWGLCVLGMYEFIFVIEKTFRIQERILFKEDKKEINSNE